MLRLPFAILLLPSGLMAGGSANYSLAPDALDAGGLRGVSASYTVNFSAMPGNAGNSADYAARTGFAGQLLDAVFAVATGISVSASPPTIDDGGTRQLAASLLYDDSTSFPLSPSVVRWSIQSGPLTGISASGLATAAAVYQDTTATVKGTYHDFTATLNLSVLNTNPDNFSAYASDGIPDDWQIQYFGIDNPNAAPLLDPDLDGWDNRFEYNACLIPTDPLSTFSMRISEAPGGGHAITFSPRFADCRYTLFGGSDLSLWEPVAGATTDAGIMRTILDPLGGGDRRFYFISVQRQ
ncbi:MAG TPA: hypothetical protein VG796_05000 [Verrucomicrobiales bacterium]|nr:hypothetical protein [Verrucomicrobiales bacterium]